MAGQKILIVEYDDEERRRISEMLVSAGYDVIRCPGPEAPNYVCAGGLGLPCPLAREADLVVLDMRIAGDVMMRGTPAWELLVYYMEHGMRIVALSNGEDSVHPLTDERVTAIRRPADEKVLVKAVRELLSRRSLREAPRHGMHIAR